MDLLDRIEQLCFIWAEPGGKLGRSLFANFGTIRGHFVSSPLAVHFYSRFFHASWHVDMSTSGPWPSWRSRMAHSRLVCSQSKNSWSAPPWIMGKLWHMPTPCILKLAVANYHVAVSYNAWATQSHGKTRFVQSNNQAANWYGCHISRSMWHQSWCAGKNIAVSCRTVVNCISVLTGAPSILNLHMEGSMSRCKHFEVWSSKSLLMPLEEISSSTYNALYAVSCLLCLKLLFWDVVMN